MDANRVVKLNVSAEATQKLRTLKARTGLTPNITSRLGLSLSLREPGIPDPTAYESDGMEFNSYTLFGAHESTILALVRERCIQDGINISVEFGELLRAHVNRGVSLIYPRVRSVSNLLELLPVSASETSEADNDGH